MLLIKSNDITKLYKNTLIKVNRLPNLEEDPKNYKDTPAVLILCKYESEPLMRIKDGKFHSEFSYEQFIPGGNELMKMEIDHYNNLFFANIRLDYLITHLRKNPYSKKAIINFWKYNYSERTDIPCVIYASFKKRNDALDMSCHMRANDAFRLLIMDIHIMTTIHQHVSDLLRIKKGSYHHLVDSLHFYKRDKENIDKLLLRLNGQ